MKYCSLSQFWMVQQIQQTWGGVTFLKFKASSFSSLEITLKNTWILSEQSRLPQMWSSRLETCARTFLYPYPEIGFFTVKSVKIDELTPKFDTIQSYNVFNGILKLFKKYAFLGLFFKKNPVFWLQEGVLFCVTAPHRCIFRPILMKIEHKLFNQNQRR